MQNATLNILTAKTTPPVSHSLLVYSASCLGLMDSRMMRKKMWIRVPIVVCNYDDYSGSLAD